MDRAKQFYEKYLGLTPSQIWDEGKWVEYDLKDGGCFALTTLATDVSPSAKAGGCIAFEVDNLEELMDQLKSNGVQIKLDIFSSPVCRMAVIIDSEGNALMLHQLNRKS